MYFYFYLLQVIARENKGSGVGIEYAYSRPVTSLANPTDAQKERLLEDFYKFKFDLKLNFRIHWRKVFGLLELTLERTLREMGKPLI